MCDPVTRLANTLGSAVSGSVGVAAGLAGSSLVGSMLGKKQGSAAAPAADPAAERAAAEAKAAQDANTKLAQTNRRRRSTVGSLMSQGAGPSQVTFGDPASTTGQSSSLMSRGGVL